MLLNKFIRHNKQTLKDEKVKKGNKKIILCLLLPLPITPTNGMLF